MEQISEDFKTEIHDTNIIATKAKSLDSACIVKTETEAQSALKFENEVLIKEEFDEDFEEFIDIKKSAEYIQDITSQTNTQHKNYEYDITKINVQATPNYQQKEIDETKLAKEVDVVPYENHIQSGEAHDDQEIDFEFYSENENGIYQKQSKCDYCQTFIPSSALKVHIDYVHLKKQYESFECTYCQKDFSLKSNLIVHINAVHLKISKRYTCEYCEKSYSLKSYLEAHINIEHLKKVDPTLKCQFCQKTFLIKILLDRHIHRVHLKKNDSLLSCEICKKTYSNKYSLNGHMKMIHLNPNDYSVKCEFCDKQYTRKQSLNAHIQIVHLKTRTYYTMKCQICEKQFSRRTSLEKHMKSVHS